MLDDTIGPELKHKVAAVRCTLHTVQGSWPVCSAAWSPAPRVTQIYKLADDFTFSGSEETFSQLQAMLVGLEARCAAEASLPSTLRLTPAPALAAGRSAPDCQRLLKHAQPAQFVGRGCEQRA